MHLAALVIVQQELLLNTLYSRTAFRFWPIYVEGFLGSSAGKESACNAGDPVRLMGWDHPLDNG